MKKWEARFYPSNYFAQIVLSKKSSEMRMKFCFVAILSVISSILVFIIHFDLSKIPIHYPHSITSPQSPTTTGTGWGQGHDAILEWLKNTNGSKFYNSNRNDPGYQFNLVKKGSNDVKRRMQVMRTAAQSHL